MLKLMILLIFSGPWWAFAKTASVFEQTISKYQKAKLISMKVEKSVKSELLGKETKYVGKIQLASGKFRWENETPDQTLLLFDGKSLMNVQFPSKDFGGAIQVAKSKIDEKSKKQILISSLLSPSSAKSNFKVLKENKKGANVEVEVQPDSADLQIKNLTILINPKSKKIEELSYKDDVGNTTRMQFQDVQFSSKADPKLFIYKIPKGAQVTNL